MLLALCFSFALVSCDKDRDYDEAEVKASAETLIRKSKKLNEIFWGKGILCNDLDTYQNGAYYPADFNSQLEFGFFSVDEILEESAKVFSSDYCISINDSVFSSKTGEFGMLGYARYYQEEALLMVYSKYEPLLTDTVEYLYDTIEVLGSDGDIVNVKISVKVTRGELSQTRDIEIALIEEANGWRIDSPTYVIYREDIK